MKYLYNTSKFCVFVLFFSSCIFNTMIMDTMQHSDSHSLCLCRWTRSTRMHAHYTHNCTQVLITILCCHAVAYTYWHAYIHTHTVQCSQKKYGYHGLMNISQIKPQNQPLTLLSFLFEDTTLVECNHLRCTCLPATSYHQQFGPLLLHPLLT